MNPRASLLLLLCACSSGSSGEPPRLRPSDGGRTRRVIEPPPGQVRALPPHAIDAGGVGPYRLGATQSDVFALLPSIPRVAILDVEKVLDASVIRTEDDTLLVGGRPGEPISFIAVLASGIARTEGGLAVGARRADLASLGPAAVDPRAAHDPNLVSPAAMPGVHFVLDGDRVSAILLEAVPEAVPAPPPTARDAGAAEPPAAGCVASLPAPEAELVAAAGAKPGPAVHVDVHPACFTSAAREAIVTAGDVITFLDGDGTHARKVGALEVSGLIWAAPLRNDLDRDDVVAISERRSDDELVVGLTVIRVEGGRLVRTLDEPVYPPHTLTKTSAQWIGARLDDVRLLVTVDARPDGFLVGGALVHAPLSGVRDVAPLLPVSIPRRRRPAAETSPAPEPPDAGPTHDAGRDAAPARDAGK